MKAILCLFDSLNRRFLPPYGNTSIHAPNFSRLAQKSLQFNQAHIGSMPCMPARRELHTGRYNFLHRSWGPLEPFDDSMPALLDQAGVYSHLATDHQHYFEDGGATYHTRYTSWEFFRGQEGDPWKPEVASPELPPRLFPRNDRMERQDWINRQYILAGEGFPQERTFRAGIDFLERNQKADNWFLQIETFDPHEPFFASEEFRELYKANLEGPLSDWPPYREVRESPGEVERVRREYAALVSMCDYHLGQLLDSMDALDLWKDTLLLVTTDHGFLLGEHEQWAKMHQPFYQEVAHIPFFLWDPRSGQKNEIREQFVQWIDIAPTILHYFGVEVPTDMQGISLHEVCASDAPGRAGGLAGKHGDQVYYFDGRYAYMRGTANPENTPLANYTLMPTLMRSRMTPQQLQDATLAPPFSFTKGTPLLRLPVRSQRPSWVCQSRLYDLAADPGQASPLVDPELESLLTRRMVALMQTNDAPPEQYVRLGLLA